MDGSLIALHGIQEFIFHHEFAQFTSELYRFVRMENIERISFVSQLKCIHRVNVIDIQDIVMKLPLFTKPSNVRLFLGMQ